MVTLTNQSPAGRLFYRGRRSRAAHYSTNVAPTEEDILGDGGDGDDDPMLAKALEVIRTTKRASTSNLQRKLRIGYNRAARIMDELEDRGIVGSDNGAQPREILKGLDSF